MDSGELARLRALADVDELDAFLSANHAIHLAIAQAAGNRRAARILQRLLDDSERAQLVALRAGAASGGLRARQEHQAVLAAIEAGDGGRARALMAEAIGTFRDELVGSLQRAVLDMPLP
jgi:DNA-binding GntR family transcriptional regulator